MTNKQRSEIVAFAKVEGIEAYCAGVPEQLCPYEKRAYRAAWLKGWHQTDREVMAAIAAPLSTAPLLMITHAHHQFELFA